MFRLIWTASIYTRDFLHRYMPSNIVLDAPFAGCSFGL